MASTVMGAIRVVLGLDSATFTSGLTAARKHLRDTGKQMETVGQTMSTVGAGMTAAITAPLIAAGFAASRAATESADAMGQVEAALTSMGDASGRTKEQLAGLATDIMRKSLYDDDDILRKVTANLLTFGNVSGQQFDRAQMAAVNLATRMKMDLQPATLLIGKALNDPVKGLTAMGRAGIQFTASQKETIKSMVAAGNAAGAQSIILGELERQFGGSAEAAQRTDPYDRLRDSFNDLSESAGVLVNTYLRPLIDAAAGLFEGFNGLSPEMQKVAVIGAAVAAAMGPALIVIGQLVTAVGAITAAFATGGLLAGLGGFVLAAAPFVAAAAAIAAAIWIFRDDLIPIFSEFKDAVMQAVGPYLPGILARAREAFAAIGPAISAVVGIVGPILGGLTKLFVAAFGPVLITMLKVMAAEISGALQIVTNVLRFVASLLTGDWAGAWNAAGSVVMSIVQTIGRVVEAVFPGITRTVGKMVQEVTTWLTGGLARTFDWVKTKAREVGDAFYQLYDRVVGHSYVPDMVDEIGQHMARLQSVMNAPVDRATKTAAERFAQLREDARQVMQGLLTDQEALTLKYLEERKKLTDAIALGGPQADTLRTGVDRLDASYRRDRAGLDAQDLVQANVPELNQNFPEIDRLNGMWSDIQQKIKASRDDFADAFEYGINAALRGDWRGVLQSIFGSLMSNGLKALGGKLFDGLGGSSPGGFSLGNIGKLASSIFKKLPGFANGGSILPGGAGGIDSQVVSFRKSPWEQVDIHTPGKDRGAGGAYALSVNPSPYFDVQVRKVATPLATQSGIASAQYSRSKTMDDLMRRQTYSRGNT